MSRMQPLMACALAALLTAACATVAQPLPAAPGARPVASAPRVGASAPAARAPTPAASAPEPAAQPALRAFDAVVKDATREEGFFPVWRKDDRVWIELAPEQWGKPFLLALNLTHGIGDGELFGNRMGTFMPTRGTYIASLRKFGTNGVQLMAQNSDVTAAPGNPARFMLERSFSESLLAQASVVSQPHPETKAVLVEVNALLVNDFPGGAGELERQFRQSYSFDSRNSGVVAAKNSERETGFRVRAHYTLGRVAPTGASLPSMVPDPRSLFLGFYYGFMRLPEPMRPRRTDPRVGYFATEVDDFSDPNQRKTEVRHIARWRLEKQDPAAALSPPREPVVFWLDRNIPHAYRDAVKAGILEWNKAFERIGYKDAIVVRQQGDDDDMDTSALRFASVRWVTSRGLGFAGRAPSKKDPRTGEILDADIMISDSVTRLYSGRAADDPPKPVGAQRPFNPEQCDYADAKLADAAFAMDLLAARGQLEWGTPEAQRWVVDSIKDVVIHEVGHALGLRHNFRGSTGVTAEQLRDPAWTAQNGISASVMDYNAPNLAMEGERQGEYWMTTLGKYDYWAIEYGYKPLDPESEESGLARILARSGEPGLAYASDEDLSQGSALEGIDPEVNQFDMTDDPLAYYGKRFGMVRELWARLQRRELPAGTPYSTLRRNFERGFAIVGSASSLAVRYVGGVSVSREVAGTGRQPLVPVPAARQREALNLVTRQLFEVDSFRFPAAFLGRMLPDWDDRAEAPTANANRLDNSVSQRVLDIQRNVLSQLLRDSVAQRLISADEQAPADAQALTLAQLYGQLQAAIWRDLAGAAAIDPMRRNLQREHIRLLVDAIARPNARMPADARSLQREFAQRLLRQMKSAVARRGRSEATLETRAHLNESMALLDAALKAQIARSLG